MMPRGKARGALEGSFAQPRRHDDQPEGHMGDWHDFFLAQAGAAGVLTGLVFVGVSINLEKILSDPTSGLAGRAAEALVLLVAVLTASCLLLVPGQGALLVGIEVLAIGVADWASVVSIQLLRVRNWPTMGSDLRQSFVLRVALGQVATLPFLAAGPAVLGWGMDGLYWLVAGMVFSVLAAMFEAWVLLIEINR
jgi:hypothetical protein